MMECMVVVVDDPVTLRVVYKLSQRVITVVSKVCYI